MRVHGAKRWKTIAGLIKSKTPPECCQRWRALQSLGSSVKRAWLPSEDRRIVELVAQYGARQWAVIASHIDGRTGKQCRERCVCARMCVCVFGWLNVHQCASAVALAPLATRRPRRVMSCLSSPA